jgi:hypothetical protein
LSVIDENGHGPAPVFWISKRKLAAAFTENPSAAHKKVRYSSFVLDLASDKWYNTMRREKHAG